MRSLSVAMVFLESCCLILASCSAVLAPLFFLPIVDPLLCLLADDEATADFSGAAIFFAKAVPVVLG